MIVYIEFTLFIVTVRAYLRTWQLRLTLKFIVELFSVPEYDGTTRWIGWQSLRNTIGPHFVRYEGG